MADTLLSWDNFYHIQKYVTKLLNISEEWHHVHGCAVNTNEFIYDSCNYHIFISCRNILLCKMFLKRIFCKAENPCRQDNSFGFGICILESMKTIINETIKYDQYKLYLFNRLQHTFNLQSAEYIVRCKKRCQTIRDELFDAVNM